MDRSRGRTKVTVSVMANPSARANHISGPLALLATTVPKPIIADHIHMMITARRWE